MKHKFIAFLVLSIILVGCSKSAFKKVKEKYPTNKPIAYIKKNIITKDYCDLFARTQGYEDQICINNTEDWRALCEKANAIFDDAILKPARVASAIGKANNSLAALTSVAKNGGASFVDTKWIDEGEFGQCRMMVRYQGFYDGSEVREILSAEVSVMGLQDGDAVVVAK